MRMAYPYKRRCKFPKCKEYVEAGNYKQYCEEHDPKNRVKLRNNNPKGYNKHKKNPSPVRKVTEFELFTEKSEVEQRKEISELGNELYQKEKELRPLKLKFRKYKDHFDRKLFGWKWED